MGSRARAALGIIAVVAGVVALPAQAAPEARPPIVPREVAGPVPAAIAATVGESARPTADGGFNIHLPDGTVRHTHGPDPKRGKHGGPTQLADFGDERTPVCATGANYQHFLYGRVTGSTDNSATAIPEIQRLVRVINNILYEAALESSGDTVTADFKVKCDGAGAIQVDTFTAPSDDFDDIAAAAAGAGFTNQNVDFSIFFDSPATVACGIGDYFTDEQPGAGNANNNPGGAVPGGYAVTYGGPDVFGTNDDCWQTTTPMHENGHNQGAVQASAPNSTGDGGHCNTVIDVMCYAPDGGNLRQTEVSVCAEEKYDCNYDDYFDALVESDEDFLDTGWNIGSSVNRFIEFGALGTTVRVADDVVVNESAGTATVTIQRVGEPTTEFDVDFTTGPGTNGEAEDFTDSDRTTAGANPIHFANGDLTETVLVPIVNDTLSEGWESVALTLTNVVNESAPVTIDTSAAREIDIRPSDQQPDEWLKIAGGSYRGNDVYNLTAAGQTISTSARRGQTKTFYLVVQNDGQVQNTFAVRGLNSSGTVDAYKIGSSVLTRYFTSSTGRSIRLHPGQTATVRVDFTMGRTASGTETLLLVARWVGDSAKEDRAKINVRVV